MGGIKRDRSLYEDVQIDFGIETYAIKKANRGDTARNRSAELGKTNPRKNDQQKRVPHPISDNNTALHKPGVRAHPRGGPPLPKQTAIVEPPAEIIMNCFSTVGAVDLDETNIFLIRGVLLDTGASGSSLQRICAEAMGLKLMRYAPVTFTMANGSKEVSDHWVQFTMWMGGVKGLITAYVSDARHDTPLIIGQPALQDFRVSMEVIGAGTKRRVKGTVSSDTEGQRSTQYLIPRINMSEMLNAHRAFLMAKVGETVVRNEDRRARHKSRLADYARELDRELLNRRVDIYDDAKERDKVVTIHNGK